MKLIIDLQACQSPESRNRGIGRYSHSLAQSIARQAEDHDLWLFLTDVHAEGIETIRQNYDGIVPQEKIIVWRAPELTSEFDRNSIGRRLAVEAAREAYLTSLNPDFVHISSLFEIHENCITSIGHVNPRPATSVTLYDLIPLVHKDRYLVDQNASWWYLRKLDQLKKADLLLAISEHSRNEAIEHLSLESSAVVSIFGAADAHFKKVILSADQKASVRSRYGLIRPFVMYTGGIDYRKNMEGLISAYARLPISTRANHQLAIVCKVLDSERECLINFAKNEGMEPHELIITGYVPEEDLVVLYNLCKLFIFPSWHEGFGLPILEAMACGVPVIAGNRTSLPEIIGRPDALFDPFDLDSICSKMELGLSDSEFRASLIESGIKQARKFTWDNTGKIALTAFEEKVARNNESKKVVIALGIGTKPKLACVTPMPPEKTGIANYSAELLPFLAVHFDIDVIVDQENVDEKAMPSGCRVRDASWFIEHGNEYTYIIYHFGNSLFHLYMYDLLMKHPGVVVLHDFFLSGPFAHLDLTGENPGIWGRSIFNSHGYRGVRDIASTHDYLSLMYKYPCNRDVLEQATGVIVHSKYSAGLAQQWYGFNSTDNWQSIPLIRVPLQINQEEARAALGIEKDEFLFCSFGILGQSKLNDRLIDAWVNSSLACKKNMRLIFVGEIIDPAYAVELNKQLQSAGILANGISITGFVDNNNYSLYLAAADIGVQLRSLSRGETSGAALDCLAIGLPLIVNAHAAMAELPTQAVVKLPDLFTREELVTALEELQKDHIRREVLRYESVSWLRRKHAPDVISLKYRDTLLKFGNSSKALLNRCTVNGDESTQPDLNWQYLAEKSLHTAQPAYGARQLFVDVSVLVNVNANTGIQRVTIGLLKALLLNPLPGISVEPVYLGAGDKFWYARRFCASFMDYGYTGFSLGLKDELVVIHAGDVFLGLDLVVNQLELKRDAYQLFRDLGAKLAFVVYDLLPVNHPQWFYKPEVDNFVGWLSVVNEIADEVLCISNTIAEEFSQQFNNQANRRPIKITSFKLGSIFSSYQEQVRSSRLAASPHRNGIVDLECIKQVGAQFLMVGTIEPRKGHSQALDALEILWKQGYQVQLVIAGRLGWLTEELNVRIHNHSEFGKRLHWYDNPTDDKIAELYKTSAGLLLTSQGEGLGLTLLEAASFGLPVIARNIPVFHEVAGDCVTYFQGNDGESLATVIQSWLNSWVNDKVPDSLLIDIVDMNKSANQVINLLGLNSECHSKYLSRPTAYPRETERMISFGSSLEHAVDEKSTFLEGIVDAGTEEAELVVGFVKIEDNLAVTLQESAIVLTTKAVPLKIDFKFSETEFCSKVDAGNTFKAFHTSKASNKYVIKLLLRRLNHEILYEYQLPLESTEDFPHGKLCTSQTISLFKSEAHAPTIRLCAPTVMSRDAIGNYCRNTAKIFEAQGYRVQIYADNFDLSDFRAIKKYSELYRDIQKDDVIIVNYSIFDPQLNKLKALSNKKIIIFQNVTPSDMLEQWDLATSIVCAASSEQFTSIAEFDDIFVSTYYTGLILQSYFAHPKKIRVIPPLYHWQYHDDETDKPKRSVKTKLLFVGRLVPNKCIEDLIKMYFEYLKFDWEATITIVGSDWNTKYRTYLNDLVREFGFQEGQVNFAGSITDSELRYQYQTANAFVCMSEHEGYCIPIVEAMFSKIPVFAYSHPAVCEVLGNAGVKISDKLHWAWAERISLTLKDQVVVEQIVEQQNNRVREIFKEADGAQLIELMIKYTLNSVLSNRGQATV
jgi:glycosyltransferase involved in cell wall biosynthesis